MEYERKKWLSGSDAEQCKKKKSFLFFCQMGHSFFWDCFTHCELEQAQTQIDHRSVCFDC